MLRLALGLFSITSCVLAQPGFEERASASMERGRRALLSTQRGDGAFANNVGEHALVLLALVHSGADPESASMKRALRPLRRQAKTNYERAVRLMAIELLKSPSLKETAQGDLEDLVHHQSSSGGWDYGAAGERTDNSCTQYALLGLRAAHKLGLQTPRAVWKKALRYLLGQQARDGGVGYTRGKEATASMTAGAVSSLAATAARSGLRDNGSHRARVDRSIKRATAWLAKRWKPGQGPHPYYTLYGLERAMAFSGQDRLGTRDWYREGAAYLLKHQQRDGWWGPKNIRRTSFALLFLSRASTAISGETPGSVHQIMTELTAQSQSKDVTGAVARLKRTGRGAVSQVVHYLSDPVKARRRVAARALRELTGKSFGYDPGLPVDENGPAIEDWKKFVSSGK